MSAEIGNHYAGKPARERATDHLHCRCHPEQKKLWKMAAQISDQKLCTWVQEILNEKARELLS